MSKKPLEEKIRDDLSPSKSSRTEEIERSIEELRKTMEAKPQTRVVAPRARTRKKPEKVGEALFPEKFSFSSDAKRKINNFLKTPDTDKETDATIEVEARFGYFTEVKSGTDTWHRFQSNIKSGYVFSQLRDKLLALSDGAGKIFEEVEDTYSIVRTLDRSISKFQGVRSVEYPDVEIMGTLYQRKIKTDSHVDNIEWGIRVSLANEQGLDVDEEEDFERELQKIRDEWQEVSSSPSRRLVGGRKKGKTYSELASQNVMMIRHRYRSSFRGQGGQKEPDDEAFRYFSIELSRVNEEHYKRDGSVAYYTNYEVEVERERREHPTIEAFHIVLKKLLMWMQNVTSPERLMSLPEKRWAFQAHNGLFRHHITMDRWKPGRDGLKLYKKYWNRPKNVKRNDILDTRFHPAVTIKLDGVRRFIYFTKKGVYMYSAPYDMYKIGDPIPEYEGTYIDCEYMDDMGQELFSFDCLFWKGKNVMNEGFRKRLAYLQSISNDDVTANLWDTKYLFKTYFGVREIKPEVKETSNISELLALANILRKEEIEEDIFSTRVSNAEQAYLFSLRGEPLPITFLTPEGEYVSKSFDDEVTHLISEARARGLLTKKKRVSEKEEVEEEDTFYDRVNEALMVSERDFAGRTDGLIFQPWTHYQNNYTFKWKPPSKLTIDFLFSKMTPTEEEAMGVEGKGFWLMVVSEKKKKKGETFTVTTIGEEEVLIEKKAREEHPLIGRKVMVVVGSEKGKVGRIVGVTSEFVPMKKGAARKAKSRQFRIEIAATGRVVQLPLKDFRLKTAEGTVQIEVPVEDVSPPRYLTFNGSSTRSFSGFISVPAKEKIFDRSIFECAWDYDRQTFVIVRSRVDRDLPNGYGTALAVWSDMMYPLTEDTIRGLSLQLARRYNNTQKDKLLMNNFAAGDTILDIGSGRGGDLRKWEGMGLSRVYVVEPDEGNLQELGDRKREMLMRTDVITIDVGAQETDFISDELSKYGNLESLDGITAFFSLTFFPESTQMYGTVKQVQECANNPDLDCNSLLNTLSLLPVGGKFVGVVQDGKETRELIESQGTVVPDTEGFKKFTSPAFSIEQVSEFTRSPIGNEIEINLTDPESMVKDQREWLFYYAPFKRSLEKLGFRELGSGFMDTGESFSQLSPLGQTFSRLNRMFVFQKGQAIYRPVLAPPKGRYGKLAKAGRNWLFYSSVRNKTYLSAVLTGADKEYEKMSPKEQDAVRLELRRGWAENLSFEEFSGLYGGRLIETLKRDFHLTDEQAFEKFVERLRNPHEEVGEAYLLALVSRDLKVNVYTLKYSQKEPLRPMTVLSFRECKEIYTNDTALLLVTSDLVNFYLVSINKKGRKTSKLGNDNPIIKKFARMMCPVE